MSDKLKIEPKEKIAEKLKSNYVRYPAIIVSASLFLWLSFNKFPTIFRSYFRDSSQTDLKVDIATKEDKIAHLNYKLLQNEVVLNTLKDYKKELQDTVSILKKANSFDLSLNLKILILSFLALIAMVTVLMAKLYDDKNNADRLKKFKTTLILVTSVLSVLLLSIKEFGSLNNTSPIVESEIQRIENSTVKLLELIEQNLQTENIKQEEVKSNLLRTIDEYKILREGDNSYLIDLKIETLSNRKLNSQVIELVNEQYDQKLQQALKKLGFKAASSEVAVKYLKESSIKTFKLSSDQTDLKDQNLGYFSFWLIVEILLTTLTTKIFVQESETKEVKPSEKN